MFGINMLYSSVLLLVVLKLRSSGGPTEHAPSTTSNRLPMWHLAIIGDPDVP